MHDDIVRRLGYLSLGSRLKRIGERLQADTQQIFLSEGVEIAPALVPTLRTLHRDGETSIGGIAESLGISQPGVTRNVAQLERLGFVRTLKRGSDQRVRLIGLTAKGRALIDHTIAVIEPRVTAAVADVCAALDGPLLDQLARIEDELAALPLHRRSPSRPKGDAA